MDLNPVTKILTPPLILRGKNPITWTSLLSSWQFLFSQPISMDYLYIIKTTWKNMDVVQLIPSQSLMFEPYYLDWKILNKSFSPIFFVFKTTRIDLDEFEHATCLKHVSLKSEGTVSGLKGYIAVATNYSYGEELQSRGRVCLCFMYWLLYL